MKTHSSYSIKIAFENIFTTAVKILLIIASTVMLTFCSHSNLFSFLSKKHCNNSYDHNYKGSFKVGSPYKINNITYYPEHNPDYDRIGLASWYGDDFHCKKTANGESFNKNQLSAAHQTLPLPSIARVTNLENGKSVTVVINDRGPFVGTRIIDLSERAAEVLAMKARGVAKVRVQYLADETNMLHADLKINNKSKYASNIKPARNDIRMAQKASRVEKEFAVRSSPYVKHHNNDITLAKTEIKKLDSGKEVSIVVGKYENKNEALQAVKKLSSVGYAKLSQIFNKGKSHYEVQLASSIRDKNQASQLLRKVIDLGNPDAYFVSKN